MEIQFASRELERQCTEQRYMKRKLTASVAKSLMLRLSDLRAAEDFSDLALIAGKWKELKGNRAGQWSARLSANWRLVVRPLTNGKISVEVLEITDYH